MPRGIKKTYTQRRRERESDKRWLERRNKEKPRRSPCLQGRRNHRFRSNRTHGPLNVRDHGDYKCWWCKKTYAQVIEEQKTSLKMSHITNNEGSK